VEIVVRPVSLGAILTQQDQRQRGRHPCQGRIDAVQLVPPILPVADPRRQMAQFVQEPRVHAADAMDKLETRTGEAKEEKRSVDLAPFGNPRHTLVAHGRPTYNCSWRGKFLHRPPVPRNGIHIETLVARRSRNRLW